MGRCRSSQHWGRAAQPCLLSSVFCHPSCFCHLSFYWGFVGVFFKDKKGGFLSWEKKLIPCPSGHVQFIVLWPSCRGTGSFLFSEWAVGGRACLLLIK